MNTPLDDIRSSNLNEAVSEILSLAVSLGITAAQMDPGGYNAYRAFPPVPPRVVLHPWMLAFTPFLPAGGAIWAMQQPVRPFVLAWYIGTHRLIETSHYYVTADGVLYGSQLQHPVNGEVEVFQITEDLLGIMPWDDLYGLLMQMRAQRAWQLHYLSG